MKTPQQSYPALAKALGVSEIYLKREDLHPYGSHKGRAIPYMIKTYVKKSNIRDFVISSSGNAALAATMTVQAYNQNNRSAPLSLQIFVGKQIDTDKLERIKKEVHDPRVRISQVERPKQIAFLLDKTGEAKNLRQSTDELALIGYFSLAEELGNIPELQAVFIPSSSGTTAQGIALGFQKQKLNPELHIIQTTSCHPLVDSVVTQENITDEVSLAGAIVDNVAHRKEQVSAFIHASGGAGWIATNPDILLAIELVKKHTNLTISANSALSLVGVIKAKQAGFIWTGPIACLICGA